jgi:hypothetical protein
MPTDMGGKSPLRDGSNEKSILAKIKQISSLLQFKTCAPALTTKTGLLKFMQRIYLNIYLTIYLIRCTPTAKHNILLK